MPQRLRRVVDPNQKIGFGLVAVWCVAIAMRCDAIALRCGAFALRCVAMRCEALCAYEESFLWLVFSEGCGWAGRVPRRAGPGRVPCAFQCSSMLFECFSMLFIVVYCFSIVSIDFQ